MANIQFLYIIVINILLVLFEIFINYYKRQQTQESSLTLSSFWVKQSETSIWFKKYKFQLTFLFLQVLLYQGSHKWLMFVLPLCLLFLSDQRNYYLLGLILVMPLVIYSISKFKIFPNTKVSEYLIKQSENDLLATKIDFVLNKILALHNNDCQVNKILQHSVIQNTKINDKQKLNALTKILIRNNVVQSYDSKIKASGMADP